MSLHACACVFVAVWIRICISVNEFCNSLSVQYESTHQYSPKYSKKMRVCLLGVCDAHLDVGGTGMAATPGRLHRQAQETCSGGAEQSMIERDRATGRERAATDRWELALS